MHVCQGLSDTGLWHCDMGQGDLMSILLPTKPWTLDHSTQSVTTACADSTASCMVVTGSVMGFGLTA